MFTTLRALWGALRTTARVESDSLLRVLYFYLFSIYSFAALQAAIPQAHNFMVALGFAIIAANTYQLFRISRLIRLTVAGELLEVGHVIPNTTGITSNDLIKLYWNIAVEMFIFISALCFLIPRMHLDRQWYLAIMWPTIAIAAAILLGSARKPFFRVFGTIAFLAIVAFVSRETFPQIDAQLWPREFFGRALPYVVADQVNEIERLREEQREAQMSRDLIEVENWVRTHPNEPYSMEHQIFTDGVKKGERKTLAEVRDDIAKGKTTSSTTPTAPKDESVVKITFDQWNIRDKAWRKIAIPEKLRGKPFWLVAEGIHYQPYLNQKTNTVEYFEANPSTGENPWFNYPLEKSLPIADKKHLCKLIVRVNGYIIFAGNRGESPIMTNDEYIPVSLNMVQDNPSAWTQATGEITIKFIPVDKSV